ncbi:serine/threonine-protein kinase PLK2-like isoform X2 [Lampetra fluviatilis]
MNPAVSPPVLITDAAGGRSFIRGQLLGKGGFARCYEATDMATQKVYAIKVIPHSRIAKPYQREKVEREVELHGTLRHPHVVRFYYHFQDAENVYLLLEHCSRRSLAHLIKARKFLTEPEVRYFLQQIVAGLKYLHACGIVHRDIKLGNFFITERMQLKIGDFGLAIRLGEGVEQKSYTMLVGRLPFHAGELRDMYRYIREARYPLPATLGHSARSLIAALLRLAPGERLDLDGALQHPFFTQGFTPERLSSSCCYCSPDFPQELSPTRALLVRARDLIFGSGGSGRRDKASRDAAPADGKPDESLSEELARRTALLLRVKEDDTGSKKPPLSPVPTWLQWKCRAQRRDSWVRDAPGLPQQSGTTTTAATSPRSGTVAATTTIYSPTAASPPRGGATTAATTTSPWASSSQASLITPTTPLTPLPGAVRILSAATPPPFTDSIDFMGNDTLLSITDTFLELLNQCLESTQMAPRWEEVAAPASPPGAESPPLLWAVKWIDYSNKYGFGYQLSDRSVAVLFNDATHLRQLHDRRTIHACVRGRLGVLLEPPGPEVAAPLPTHASVLRYLARYMQDNLVEGADLPSDPRELSDGPEPVLLKWKKTDSAILLLFSHHVLQVNFFSDHTKVMLSRHAGGRWLLTFVSEERAVTTRPLDSLHAHGVSPALRNRLQVARKLLR